MLAPSQHTDAVAVEDSRLCELPSGWTVTTLADICLPVEKIRPKTTPDRSFTYLDIASIDNSQFRLVSPKVILGKDAPSRARQKVKSGNVLFSTVRTYLKNIAMVPPEFDGEVASTGFCILNPADEIDHRFIFYLVLNDEFISKLNPLQRGTSYPAVRDGDVLSQAVVLPPLPEQRRIVAEIEKQFTRLDASVDGLKRAQANLKRYRSSVLKAACEGKLVPTEAELAQSEGRDYEPADRLLERILAERRAQWGSQKRHRGKYKEPTALDISDLSELPEGWAWTTVDQIVTESEYGTSVKCSYEADGHPVVRIPNIVAGEIDLTDIKYATQPFKFDSSKALNVGDVLMCRTNGSVKLIGRTAVVKAQMEPDYAFASYLLRFRFWEKKILPLWFHIFASSEYGRSFIEGHAASSAGQHNVSLRLIHSMTLALPPLPEQHRIVAEVERHLSVIQNAEAAVDASLKRAERLRQSILKQAFSGQLVPQDPNDEPASVLLERIRAERAMAEAAANVPRKPRRRRSRSTPTRQLSLTEENT